MPVIDAYLTTTINGMIALPNGDAPWSDATWKAYYKLGKTYPAIILGRATYDILMEAAPDEFKKLGNPQVIVLSNRLKKTADKAHFIARTPGDAQERLTALKLRRALVIGGAKTVSAFLKSGLVGALIVDIEPQIFAKGIPMIDLPGQWRGDFASVTTDKPSARIVRLTYRKSTGS